MNTQLIQKLEEIANYYDSLGDVYRLRAYQNVINNLKDYSEEITSAEEAKLKIKGIGKSIFEDIKQFFEDNRIDRLSNLRKDYEEAEKVITYFQSFYGIGPASAKRFYAEGHKSINDLWFNANLNEKQKLGILYRNHLDKKIPRKEMNIINDKIKELFKPYNLKFQMVGSFRRGLPSSNDIDLLIENNDQLNLDQIVEILQPILVDTLALGPTKFMGILRLSNKNFARRCDIRLVDKESWPFALLYFTGNKAFNIAIRQRAIELGLTLNEYELKDQNQKYIANSEKDIFDILGLQYAEPEERSI